MVSQDIHCDSLVGKSEGKHTPEKGKACRVTLGGETAQNIKQEKLWYYRTIKDLKGNHGDEARRELGNKKRKNLLCNSLTGLDLFL